MSPSPNSSTLSTSSTSACSRNSANHHQSCLTNVTRQAVVQVAYNSSFSEQPRLMRIRPGIEIAGLTDVGCQRENNEDSLGYWESADDAVFARLGRLAVVADGMGGHEGGQIASHIAVEAIQQTYSNASETDPEKALIAAFVEAHHSIQQRGKENRGLQGMGTTGTACAIVGAKLYYAHVGDSRLYLLRTGTLRPLSSDQSLVA